MEYKIELPRSELEFYERALLAALAEIKRLNQAIEILKESGKMISGYRRCRNEHPTSLRRLP